MDRGTMKDVDISKTKRARFFNVKILLESVHLRVIAIEGDQLNQRNALPNKTDTTKAL